MTTKECPRLDLVEALRDGRLGVQERASMERHIAGCAPCAALARDLETIGKTLRVPRGEATPLEHQRARLALLRRATVEPPARASLQSKQLLVAAFAMAAATILAFWGGRQTAPERADVALHMGAAPHVPMAQETNLRPSDDARFSRKREAGVDVVTLEDGSLDVSLRPLAPGERFVIRTKDAEIVVRGTAMRVAAEQGHIKSVSAIEGTVEIQYAGYLAVIPSGGSWRATAETTASTPNQVSFSGNAVNVAAPAVAVAPPTSKMATKMPAPRKNPGVAAPKEKAPEAPAVSPTSAATNAPPAGAPASRAFADAMRSLRDGDYARSAADLEWFAATHPNDVRADEAEYLRAIALQRAGRASEAAAAARRYLATRPSGAHRLEAKRIAGD